MPHIELLDQITIDKIAAGEVVERPASVVKELVENAIDAGAGSVVTEIEEGGIAFIRIADNGCGIQMEEVPEAFLRHSTSKIRSAEDLMHISSLGFRGEALSSISAVAQVEMLTKRKEDLLGTRYVIEGGKEKCMEEAGTPDGTTFFVRQLFYNTPARRKFLKTSMTEASHIYELMTRLALSHPDVSFQFINNKQTKLHTSGNGKLKDVIYHIYGRDVAGNLLPVESDAQGMKISGYLGKPLISRGNRNFETYFVNGRYVKSSIISKAIEDAYKDFTMQHKYPFVVLQISLDPEKIDVNVHPTKMELRFSNQQDIYNRIYHVVREGLRERELIPVASVPEPPKEEVPEVPVPEAKRPKTVEPRIEKNIEPAEKNLDYFMDKMKERVASYHNRASQAEVTNRMGVFQKAIQADKVREAANYRTDESKKAEHTLQKTEHAPETQESKTECTPEKEERALESIPQFPQSSPQNRQLDLFEDKLLTKKASQEYKIVGQVFDTYWIIQYHDNMYIIDQHAAHERVLYERTLKGMKDRQYTSQYLSPPVILSLSMQEAEVLEKNKERFESIGFEIEPFGGDEYAVRAVPDNLFSIAKKDLLIEMLDGLADGLTTTLAPDLIDEKIASMSCKAAVKGNNKLSFTEIDTLIGELLELENPYHCPHGRPTIIAMTKRELEKKFKRIV